MSIGLPGDGGTSAVESDKGTIVYPGGDAGADIAVQPTSNGGVRSLISINSADAAKEYRYDLGLPAGAALNRLDDGSVAVSVGTSENLKAIGYFAVPWAQDANGNALPTSYRIDGTTLVQTVEFNQNTAFPVIADPWYNPGTWNLSCLSAGLGTIAGGVGAAASVIGAPASGGTTLAATGSLIGGTGAAVAGLKACN
ncbi:hypothetical protein [Kitasatospora sp. NPDC094011]|uniref:hypothetical protein n=1 Tax=Kitasatospora sp. NPDC094011 TaxID=3364090 RepID=UPI0037F38645